MRRNFNLVVSRKPHYILERFVLCTILVLFVLCTILVLFILRTILVLFVFCTILVLFVLHDQGSFFAVNIDNPQGEGWRCSCGHFSKYTKKRRLLVCFEYCAHLRQSVANPSSCGKTRPLATINNVPVCMH